MGELILENNWNTSVNELLIIFRGSLLSIVPWLEKANIKWKDEESYDDWENIALVLYENIVCASLVGEVLPEYSIAKYGFTYDDYSGVDYLKVMSKEYSEKSLALISFQSFSSPLDSVKVAILDNDDKVIGHLTLSQVGLEFLFVKNKNDKKYVIDNITVIL